MILTKRKGRIKSLGLLLALVFILTTAMPFNIALGTSYTVIQITNDSFYDSEPRIDGDRVVWRSDDGSGWDLFLYDISTGTTTNISNNSYNDVRPQIDGDRVVWSGFDGSDFEIFLATFTASNDTIGPIVSNVVATPNPVAVNTGVILTANTDDSTTGGSNVATAEYSIDGGPFTPMSSADGASDEVSEDVAANLGAFAQPAVHSIGVRGTDSAGNVGEVEYILLAVYDPTAGFVTGGGWINSPEGAYTPDPTLTGKATFGFVSKYQKGATIPTGQTEFQFRLASLNFHSTSYDWLVVSGARAQYKGSGTINGVGSYGFMLTAIDGQLNGTGIDKFRIKIWDKATDAVVYDNKLGALDTGDDATELGGGSTVIHP